MHLKKMLSKGLNLDSDLQIVLELLPFYKTFKNFSAEKDPANNCLDTAIITDPKLRSQKTIKKLEHVAGRVLKK